MVWDEIFVHYEIAPEKMEEYVRNGYIHVTEAPGGQKDYDQNDIEQIGLISTLHLAGFRHEDAKKYLEFEKDPSMEEIQLRMLKKQRRELLERIHRLQKVLDQIDFMAWNKKHKRYQ